MTSMSSELIQKQLSDLRSAPAKDVTLRDTELTPAPGTGFLLLQMENRLKPQRDNNPAVVENPHFHHLFSTLESLDQRKPRGNKLPFPFRVSSLFRNTVNIIDKEILLKMKNGCTKLLPERTSFSSVQYFDINLIICPAL